MMSNRVPLRRSLLLRLLAVSVLISICSITATAWLAVQTTTKALRQEQGRALVDDARVYDALVGYAATHRDFDGVQPVVRRLAAQTGRRIALISTARVPIADSSTTGGPLPSTASATVDPLSVDHQLAVAGSDDRIDPRAVGPFQLTRSDRQRLGTAAARLAACLRSVFPVEVTIVDQPNGRPVVDAPGIDPATWRCAGLREGLVAPTAAERAALKKLADIVDGCLQRHHLPLVQLDPATGWDHWTVLPAPVSRDTVRAPPPGTNGRIADCIGTSRRELLGTYVAPPALLFVTDADARRRSTAFELSTANRVRIATVTTSVLLAAVAVTVLAGRRMVAPLQALIGAAQRLRDGDGSAQVHATGHDEIAQLSRVFNDMAQRRREVEELRKAMVRDIAHEMRTPVTNIRGWLEAAEDGVVAPDHDLMSSLHEEAVLLQRVIDDLQDLAAADAGELALHPEPVSIGDLISQAALANRARADAAGVVLSADAPAGIVARADPVRLRQAIDNLVVNAVKHTPAGGAVSIIGRTEGDTTVIEVRDTGTGIAVGDLPRVFERFWRAEKSRNRQTGGSGLGLAIVRKLAEAHGGTVDVHSVQGCGATFTLRIPTGES